jgi:hypothetical protein
LKRVVWWSGKVVTDNGGYFGHFLFLVFVLIFEKSDFDVEGAEMLLKVESFL